MSAAFSDLPLSSQLAVEGNWSNDPDGLNLPSSQAADGVPGRNARRVAAARARNKPQNIPKKVDTLAENFRVNFEQFLEAFEEETESGPVQCYLQQISNLRRFEKTTVYIDFGHLYAFDGDLAKLAKSNYFRLEPYMKRAVQNLVLKYDPEYVQLHTRTNAVAKDSVHREFWISFYNLPAEATHRLRELKTSMIGELVAIKGTVTRTSAVQPELMYGTFQCKDCLTEIKDVEQQFKYTEVR
ncbi:MCM DNA helicase complex subunit mcm6 [Quaeritorhiza haematococci]|nr:MCM DNA helicase complex subunit mcm6 [Quaeritorhiza haematococci]